MRWPTVTLDEEVKAAELNLTRRRSKRVRRGVAMLDEGTIVTAEKEDRRCKRTAVATDEVASWAYGEETSEAMRMGATSMRFGFEEGRD